MSKKTLWTSIWVLIESGTFADKYGIGIIWNSIQNLINYWVWILKILQIYSGSQVDLVGSNPNLTCCHPYYLDICVCKSTCFVMTCFTMHNIMYTVNTDTQVHYAEYVSRFGCILIVRLGFGCTLEWGGGKLAIFIDY